MFKKLTLMVVSVAALVALVAPAAQATGPLITDSLGNAANNLTAVSENTVSTTPSGTLECATVDLNLTLSENGNTTAKGAGNGSAIGDPNSGNHNATCASSSGLGVKITGISVSEIHLTRHGNPVETTGTAKFSYTFDLYFGSTKIAHCTLDGTATVKRTGTSTINISGNLTKGTPSDAPCPSGGTITGDFTVTRVGGGTAHIK